ncbi:neurexin-4-like [Dendronephthya gigantea]|uniref:neurexin-4-like n=1 Tax=Dendronephthya gigantea TaxID=151771 RepID=UPI00106BBBD0|nr:neurexin-4-like [Dendronephthya gigantea]
MSRDTYNSCTVLRIQDPLADSGMYSLKPQGLKSSVSVFCNMTSKNSVGVTEIGHDSESKTFVKDYASAGSYQRIINYEIPMEAIVAIIQQSKNCEQFIKYECYHSVIWYSPTNVYYGWWVSRQGSKMNYWGGAAVDSGKCACGMTNSCAGKKKCNCDKNDETWREDSGYLTDKNTLPVTELTFGDTKADVAEREEGYHTLGKLRCWG